MTSELASLGVTLGLGGALAFVGSVPMTGPLALLVLDRLIAAQSRLEGLTVITRDPQLAAFGCRTLW